MAQLWIGYFSGIIVTEHEPRNPELLVNAADHHGFIDRLIRSSDKIALKIHIQIVHIFYMGKGLVDENIVYIKGMLGKLQPAFL